VILAAGLLVLVGLGLFVVGLASGTTVLYWATVVVCAVAGVLLVLSRRRLSSPVGPRPPAGTTTPARSATADQPAAAAGAAVGEHPGGAAPEPAPAPGAERARGAHAAPAVPSGAPAADGEPGVEEVEVTDLLLVVDLTDEVLVVDEHPRYHVAGCPRLSGRETIPLPLDEARTDGFTPCAVCSPDRTLAERERARRSGRA